MINEQLTQLEDFAKEKKLSIETQLDSGLTVRGNHLLAEILVSNLLGNAIKHNVSAGNIQILLKDNTLIVSNTGKPVSFEPERLFERFAKAEASTGSPGLGLSIVEQICKNSGWKCDYTIRNDIHILSICF